MNKFELYARLKQHKYRIDKSLRIINEAFGKNSDWYIAFSGGKDSTCLLSLIRFVKPDTPAVSSIQEWALPETKQYLATIDNLELVASGSDHDTGWSPNWEDADDLPHGVKWLGGRGRVAKNYGRCETGVFLGTRTEENSRRKALFNARGPLFFHKGNNVWQCSPLGEWSVMDIWAYIFSNRLEYNRAYDVMEKLGIPLEKQRIGPLAIESVLGYGQLAIVKRGWPELFNEYSAVHPEARSYI